jgi:hypothetical protein
VENFLSKKFIATALRACVLANIQFRIDAIEHSRMNQQVA